MNKLEPTQLINAIELGKEALRKHDIPAAFDHLFMAAHQDNQAAQLFLRIPNNEYWLHLISEEQVEQLKEHTENASWIAQYTLGRYYQIVEAEFDKARDLFIELSKADMADASAALAIMYRRGQLGEGPIDKEAYLQSLEDASEKGSKLGNYQRLKAEIFGLDGLEARPQEIIDGLKNWLGDESEDIEKADPMYYELIAKSYQALDVWQKASEYYRKSICMGRIESYPDYLIMTSFNHEYELIDEKGYYEGIEWGCQQGIPYCFVMRATANKDRYDNTDDEKEKEQLHQLIAEDLNTASLMGDETATVLLGNHYYYGEYGFEENNDLAWGQFVLGTGMYSADAYSMLAQIIIDGNAPVHLSEGFLPHCQLMALRLGDDNQLIPVVNAYQSGKLASYAQEIERYYVPKYNELPDDDDYPDDDGRFDAYV